MKKFLVKLELWKKSIPQKIDLGKGIFKAMTGNANFLSPDPSLAELDDAVNELAGASAEVESHGGGTLYTSVMNKKEDAFDEVMRRMGRYVDNTAKGNENIIRSAGMDVKKQREPAQLCAAAENLSATPGLLSGSIDLRWKRPKFAVGHNIYVSADIENNNAWKLIGQTTNTRFTVTGLEPLKVYWFKVEGIGSAGTGAASDPAMTHAAM
ncbi:MAG TPA: fibronectin type III domain-containing protein [Bacteroidia bacterium]|nr:fibronectin type III domain-containing protein [Bacteroidia bacterium]